DRVLEDVEPLVQVVLADGQRGSDAEDPAHSGKLHDVEVEATLEALGRHRLAERIRGPPALLRFDELKALQQPAAPHVADVVERVAHGGETRGHDASELDSALDEPVAGDDVEHGGCDGA